MKLERKLKTFDAVTLGLGSMVGAGIFIAIGPATRFAGSGVLLAVALAGLLAFLNAASMAQLAARYPESGGAYVYGRERLGNYFGFSAGWAFISGKTFSCVAMALTFAHYVYPDTHFIAPLLVLTLSTINFSGVKKTIFATKSILIFVLTILLSVVFFSLTTSPIQSENLLPLSGSEGFSGVMKAAGIMFFSFAGYARIATLGEEVIDPKKTIPRSILLSLSLTIILYLLVTVTLLLTVPLQTIINSPAPLTEVLALSEFSSLTFLVRLGATVASAGVLLSLLAGISRTVYAMSSRGDLPKSLSAVHQKFRTPYKSEFAGGIIIALLAAFADVTTAIGSSSFLILIYYSIANAAAFTLEKKDRLYPRFLSALGLFSCLAIAFSLPTLSIIGGIIILAVGSLIYFFNRTSQNR